MAKAKKRAKVFETKYFGLIIGILIVSIFVAIGYWTEVLKNLELRMLDVHFNFKNVMPQESIQEGVTTQYQNPNISPDILIIGIDFNSLSRFGRWPFPRYRHANLLDAFSRIKNQGERERAVFLDLFFIEPDKIAYDDARLVRSIEANGRVFLETLLQSNPAPADVEEEMFERQQVLYDKYGEITNVKGNWSEAFALLGLQAPLKPYARSTCGYGHANYWDDFDKIYRRQILVAKSSKLLETINFEELSADTPLDRSKFQRFAWIDKEGNQHTVPYPLTDETLAKLKKTLQAKAPQKADDTDGDGKPDTYYYVIRKYEDHFVPAITLSLALHYFNKTLSDVEVEFGKHIKIRNPEYFNVGKGVWEPYALTLEPPTYDKDGNMIREGKTRILDEITIPIDENGAMLINYMGLPSVSSPEGHQTFPIRSYAGYAARVPGPDPGTWPRTKAVANKILMVGPFAEGMAADQKTTPLGLMYGVEIHANALNTILMDKFLLPVPWWMDFAILFALIMLVAFMTSRLSTVWSLVITLVGALVFFITVTLIFDMKATIINFSSPAVAMFLTFLSVVVYRVMTEEKDKRRIRDMFGKYVSPKVVDQILENPPELGGVDKELTVLFSDIRGFTTLSESMTPQELVNHLNLYLTAMTDIILEYQGTLDKYVGDEIMCFWGAPLPQQEHALLACKCALRQMEVLRELNSGWPAERRINIGIGLNSGIMTVGNMGSTGRMNYTLMGDNVNLGARLEGTNKEYQTNIIISEYTYGLVKDRIVARELDNIRVKGKNKPVLIYELIDCPEGLTPPVIEAGKNKKP